MFAHGEGKSDMIVTIDGHIITCGIDAQICITSNNTDNQTITIGDNDSEQLTALACSNDNKKLFVGSMSGNVYSFLLPECKEHTLITRGTVPVTSISVAPNNSWIAIASHDVGIKLIAYNDYTSIQQIQTSTGVQSISFDPFSEVLAASCCDGKFRAFNISKKTLIIEIGQWERFSSSTDYLYSFSWHPNGQVVAVPGRRGAEDVVVFDRSDIWNQSASYKSSNFERSPVSITAFSPNGYYLAAADVDKHIVIWNQEGEVVKEHDLKDQEVIMALFWNPTSNQLVFRTIAGYTHILSPAIPSERPDPLEPVKLQKRSLIEKSVKVKKPKIEEEKETEIEAPLSPYDDIGIDYLDDEQVDLPHVALQPPFQPGSTPIVNSRCILAWNLIGTIGIRKDDTASTIEIDFADLVKYRRIHLIDHDNFSLGALSETGVFFASQPSQLQPRSLIHYRPFNAWAQNAEWNLVLPHGEVAMVIALGKTWTCVATNNQLLRVMSYSGVQIHSLSLPGPIVTMSGKENMLAVVYHRAVPMPNNQYFGLFLFDVDAKMKTVVSVDLPVSPGSSLTWIGFNEILLFVTMDSAGILRGLFRGSNNHWVPLLDANEAKTAKTDHLWPVDMLKTDVMCAICRSGDKHPNPIDRGVLCPFPIHIPLCDSSDIIKEDEFLSKSLFLGEYRRAASEAGRLSEFARGLQKKELLIDKIIIQMFHSALKADRAVRAMDLASMLKQDKSLGAVIELATSSRFITLAERINLLRAEADILEQLKNSDDIPSSPVLKPTSEVDRPPASAPPVKRNTFSTPKPKGSLTTPAASPSINPFAKKVPSKNHNPNLFLNLSKK